MEPVGFTVGVLGLAGLFSSCLDVLERFESWKDFKVESRFIATRFKAEKLRLEQWGQAVGLERGRLLDYHHEALDDPRILSMVEELLSVIRDVCGTENDVFTTTKSQVESKLAKGRLLSKRDLDSEPLPGSKLRRINWALRDKAKRTAQVEQFGLLVENLHNLVPPNEVNGPSTGLSDGALIDRGSWIAEFGQILARIEGEMEADRRRELQLWLLGHHYPNELYDNLIQRRVKGTCEWILYQPSFLDWSSSNFPEGSSKLFWINGPAGFGKSVLCATIIGHLSSSMFKKHIAHFFFSSDFETREDPFIAVRSWISQMLSHSSAFELVRDKWVAQYEQIATRADVIELFQEIVQAIPECIFVIDGLDECTWMRESPRVGESASVPDFLEAVQQAIANTATRILIVSRDEPEIRQCLVQNDNGVAFFEHKISPEDVQSDTALYARSIVDRKIAKKAETAKSQVSQKMAERCNGQFLWLKLQEDSLSSWKTQKQLEDTIEKTPTGLEHIYERNWMRISQLAEERRSRAFSLLRWAAFALRPLTICELTEALLMDDSDEPLVDELPETIDEEYIHEEILRLCGSLIEIRSSPSEEKSHLGLSTIHLTHFSVKQYLLFNIPIQGQLQRSSIAFPAPKEAVQSVILAKTCLRYLNCQRIWLDTSGMEDNQIFKSFRDYAAGSWSQHAAMNNPIDVEVLTLINELFDPSNSNWNSWSEWYDLNSEEPVERDNESDIIPASPVYYAAKSGLTEVVSLIIKERGYSMASEMKSKRTALGAACKQGNLEIVRVLLEAGADNTVADYKGWTPLHAASSKGHVKVVKLLLEQGADITVTSNRGWTPLIAASRSGHIEVVKLLLEKGADITVRSNNGWTPLNIASDSGHVEVVKLLMEKGADITVRSNNGWTPLNVASDSGHVEVVKLLLEKGADVTVSNRGRWTPLYSASNSGHIEVVKLLLERGVDVTITNSDGWTPLHVASFWGHVEVVKALLERRADINIETNDGYAPLNIASERGHVNVVKLLLERRADMTTSSNGWTPLHTASDSGHIEVVKFLLEKGADITTINSKGWTPLLAASNSGQIEVVKLLLEKEADINFASTDGWTPLHAASSKGHIAVVKLLVENGADVNCASDDGWTPLHAGAHNGHVEVISLLLENPPVKSDAEDQDLRTPLFHAAMRGHSSVLSLLLSYKAATNKKDRFNATPLFGAVRNGHEFVVQQLISQEHPSVDYEDGLGKTLFWWATKSGNIKVIELVRQYAQRMGIMVFESDLDVLNHLVTPAKSSPLWCNVCTRYILDVSSFYQCLTCQYGDYHICLECFDAGMRCFNDSHELILCQPDTPDDTGSES